MFGKKHVLFKAADDSRAVVNDFRLRSSAFFESYRTVEYVPYAPFSEEEMLPHLEAHLAKFLSGDSSAVDAANGNLLDAWVLCSAKEALCDLSRQHYNHGDMLRRLTVRHASDKEDVARMREAAQKRYESMQADYEKTCALVDKLYGEVSL